MATRQPYTGDGSLQEFDLSFPYLSPEDVKATVDGALVSYSWINASRIRLDAAPAAGTDILIFRDTPDDKNLTNFTDGSVLTEDDLNLGQQQLLYRQQEVSDLLEASGTTAVRVREGEIGFALPPASERAGKFQAYDSHGNPIALSGNAAPSELATAAGAALVGTADGSNVQQALDHGGYLIASGTGAVTRSSQDKHREIVSVRDFGAVGDGVTDDTAAINLALATTAARVHFPVGSYRIADPVQDGTPVLVSHQPGRHITCDGHIMATSTVLRAIGIYGADNTVQLNIEGSNKIAEAIRIYAPGCVVEKCRINDLYTATFSCVGIGTTGVNGGAILRDNIIKRLNSAGNGSTGDGNGMSRAITLSMTADATSETIIENNILEDCAGEEGDSIAIISSNGAGTYYNADVIVRDNVIKNFTRRAIKIQGNNAKIINNYITHDYAASADIPNRANVIDLVQGGNHYVVGNILNGCKWFTQISVYASPGESFSDFIVEDNKILGLGSETAETVISISPAAPPAANGNNVFVRKNIITSGTGRALSLGAATGLIVEGNIFQSADEPDTRVISLSSAVTNAVVRGNVLLSGSKQVFIGCDAANVVITDNHVKCNTPLVRDSAGSHNLLIANNSIDGTAGMVTSSPTNTGNRFGGNFNFGDQYNPYPGVLYTAAASGPSASLSGKNVRAGQIVFDTAPAAGNYIGWVATTSGDAASVTWKQFGAILP